VCFTGAPPSRTLEALPLPVNCIPQSKQQSIHRSMYECIERLSAAAAFLTLSRMSTGTRNSNRTKSIYKTYYNGKKLSRGGKVPTHPPGPARSGGGSSHSRTASSIIHSICSCIERLCARAYSRNLSNNSSGIRKFRCFTNINIHDMGVFCNKKKCRDRQNSC